MTGTNPRDFLAALGLLRILASSHREARLSFSNDGTFTPQIEDINASCIVDLIAQDAAAHAGPQPWRLEYEKREKRGVKRVADLKAPPDEFRTFMRSAIALWSTGDREAAAYAAAFGTDVAVDRKGNTKPTALHFTAANQQFLDTAEQIRRSIDRAWCEEALFKGHANRSGQNLRWDPAANRAYALMAADPNEQGTSVNAPLEWLVFRALPLMPVVPRSSRAETTGIRGRGSEMRYRWPLWLTPASLPTVAYLIRMNWWQERIARNSNGVIAICTSEILRTAQGFGNFGPAHVTI